MKITLNIDDDVITPKVSTRNYILDIDTMVKDYKDIQRIKARNQGDSFLLTEAITRMGARAPITDDPTDRGNHHRCLKYNTHTDVSGYCPYAITFTFPTDYVYDMNYAHYAKNRKRVSLIDQHVDEQFDHFTILFNKWLSKLNRIYRSQCYDFHVIQYEIFTEQTKQGLLHAHGILYCNNNYAAAMSDTMANLWVKVTGGQSRKVSMKKKKGTRIDYAFAKCADVTKWHAYISKEFTNIEK